MMNRLFSVLLAAGVAGTVFSAVEMDENLVLNGKMNADQMDLPPYWAPDAATNCRLGLSSGPNGTPAIILLPGAGKENAFRQCGLNPASNGVYTLSFMYKATKAKFGACSIGIAAAGWTLYSGVDLPADTDGWRRFTRTVVAKYCPKEANRHFLVFYTTRQTEGEVAFADISLKPADAATAAGTDFSDGAKSQRELRLVPIAPRLDEIPPKRRTVAFRFFGALPDNAATGGYVARFTAEGCAPVTLPLSRELLRVKLPAGAKGGRLTAELLPKAGGAALFARTFEYAILPEIRYGAEGRKLNNLCTELVRRPVTAGRSSFPFGVKRRSWHFFAVPGTATLNGAPLIAGDTPRREAFRELEPGDYELVVDAAGAGEAVVRRIAEIYNYCPCHPACVPENPPYDWEFQRRHVMPAVTTQCGGYPKKAELEEMVSLGRRHIFNMSGRDLKDDDDLLARLRKSPGMTDPLRAGVSCDELFLHESVNNSRHMKASWRATAAEFPGKGVYTWMVGSPAAAGLDHDFLSAAVNSCGGRSRILYEMYMPTQATEEECAGYITARMRSTAAAYSGFLPGVLGRFGMIFGNFNQLPAITVCNHPDVDYKYYLDMQWRALATDPAFDGLGLCGYWGSYYGDEEMHRWSFLLTRHYVVEGRTEPLSKDYGLAFHGLIPDGDFANGLGEWRTTDGVHTASHPKISAWRGIAWRNGTEGDTYAEMPAKTAGAASRLSYTVRGLVPGRLYAFQCCSFDLEKMNSVDKVREHTGIVVDLGGGAEKVEALSWHSIGRTTTKYDESRPGINVTHFVFRASASETVVTVSNANTPTGRVIGVNAFSVNPYVASERGATGADLPCGDDLRDRCWMFGHDSGQHDGPGNAFNIPESPKVTMGEACALMGVSNVIVCVWHAADDAYLGQFRNLKRVVWAIDNGWKKRHERDYDHGKLFDAGIERLKKMPNLVGFEYDDFFNGYAKTGTYKDRLADGTEVEVLTGSRTLAELRKARATLKSQDRPLEMRLVLYTSEAAQGPCVLPVVDQFDTVTLWTWAGSDLTKLRERVDGYRKLVGKDKPTFLGIYMWNFGEAKPIGVEAMKGQLDLALEYFRAGKLDGFVFHCTPLVNKNLPEVEMVRRWIAEHGEERIGRR